MAAYEGVVGGRRAGVDTGVGVSGGTSPLEGIRGCFFPAAPSGLLRGIVMSSGLGRGGWG